MKCEKCNNDYPSSYYFATPTVCNECFSKMPPEEQQQYQEQLVNLGYVNEYDFRIGFGRRLGASLLDVLIVSAIVLILMMINGSLQEMMTIFSMGITNPENASRFEEVVQNSIALPSFFISLIYYLMEVFFAATPGKMAFSIKIANDDRSEAEYGPLFTRFIVKHGNMAFTLVSFFALEAIMGALNSIYSLVILIGFFFVLGQRRQAFHDMAAKTAVFFKDEIISEENANTEIRNY